MAETSLAFGALLEVLALWLWVFLGKCGVVSVGAVSSLDRPALRGAVHSVHPGPSLPGACGLLVAQPRPGGDRVLSALSPVHTASLTQLVSVLCPPSPRFPQF